MVSVVDLANGQIYALGGDDSTSLFAVRLDGSIAWTKTVGALGTHYTEGPLIDAGFLYIRAGGNVQKWNAAGVLQWSTPAGGGYVNPQPSIMGDYVYINSEAGRIRKYSKNTGAEVVGSGFPIATASSGAWLVAVDGKIYHKADVLYAYNAADGSLAWSAPCGGFDSSIDLRINAPAVSGNAIYVYGYDDTKIYAFDKNTGATLPGFPSVSLNGTGGGLTLRSWNSPAVAGDKVFIGAGTSQKLKVLECRHCPGRAGVGRAPLLLH